MYSTPKKNYQNLKNGTNTSIDLEHVSKTYDGKQMAVNNLSLYVNSAEIVGLIGPNGSGKTTTLNMIVDLVIPTSGKIKVNGIDLLDNAVVAKQQIGYIPDTDEAIELLTGWEYAHLVAALYGFTGKDTSENIGKLFKAFGIDTVRHKLVETYSHGMTKKLQIIATLAHEPSVIILDEPLSGLDIESILLLKTIIKKLKKKKVAFLIATHNLALAEEMCDRVYILNQGQCIANGSPGQINYTQGVTTLEDAFIKLVSGKFADETIDEIISSH